MPDPKKNKNAPARATTDTGTGSNAANQRMKKLVKAAAAEGAQEAAAAQRTAKPTARRKATPTAQRVARPLARETDVTPGAGMPSRRPYDTDFNVFATANAPGTAAKTYSYLPDDEFMPGGPGDFTPLPRGGEASGGRGGHVYSDPFLAGFNSDDVSVAPAPRTTNYRSARNKGGNRRQSR